MPLDPRAKRFLRLLTASAAPSPRDLTVAERRAGLAELMKLGTSPPAIGAVERRRVAGGVGPLEARIYSPYAPPPGLLAGLVYFHGGGLVAGSAETHERITRALANAGGCRVVSVDYRLAPENPFPAALDDAAAAVLHVKAHAAEFGIDSSRLGICGDSAGGTLAAATCQTLAEEHNAVLALQVLLCPILDYGRVTRSWQELATGYLIDEATLEHDLRQYAPGGDTNNHRLSPLRARVLDGLPRAIIHTAEFDPLRDEGQEYSERLSQAGCDVSYTCHPGMIHLFYGLEAVIPYAGKALEQVGAEVRAAFG